MALASLPRVRPYVILGLSIFALICWVVAVAADMATAESNNTKVRMGVWYTCTRVNSNPATCTYNTDNDIGCGSYKSHFRGLQAFLIMSLVVTIPLVIASALEILHRLAMPHNFKFPGPLGIATVYAVLAALGFLFTLVAFAMDFAIPNRSFCNAKSSFSDAPGYNISASPIFALLMWITMIIIGAVAVLVPGPDDVIEPAATKTGVLGRGTANEPTTTAVPPARQDQAPPVIETQV